jgi:tRNA(Ile)-lysidine synthase
VSVAPLPDLVLAQVRAEGLFPEPGVALLAVSGGPDSIALLDLMHRLAPELGLTLVVGHVDHGIAPGSAAVAGAVERWAARYALPIRTATLSLGARASETTARAARYRALRNLQRDVHARYLVTAHHADDQVETVLLRVLKGSGMAGLAGIAPARPGGLTRPLLAFDRSTLLGWFRSRYPDPALYPPIHCDPANRDPRHERSWVRQSLVPVLAARFGDDVRRRVLDLQRHAVRDRRAWSEVLRALPGLEVRCDPGRVSLSRRALGGLGPALATAVLEAAAREVGLTLGVRRARDLYGFAPGAASGSRLTLGRGWIAETAFDRLIFRHLPAAPPPPPAVWGDAPRGAVTWGDWLIEWAAGAAGPTDRVSFVTWVTPGPGEVRARRTGECLRPLGFTGHRPLTRLLMEARIPRSDRPSYPVLSRAGSALWLPGVCRSDRCVPSVGAPALRVEARRVSPGVGLPG